MPNAAKRTNTEAKPAIDKLIRPILRTLNGTSADIEASAVMSRDGLSVASVLGDGVDPDRLSAMCASLLALADTTAQELDRGKVQQLLLEGSEGNILIVHVGKDAVLGVVAKPSINIGRVFLEAKKTAKTIAETCSFT